MGVVHAQAKDCLESPEAGRGEEVFPLRGFELSRGLPTPEFGLRVPDHKRNASVIVVSRQSVGICYGSPGKQMQLPSCLSRMTVTPPSTTYLFNLTRKLLSTTLTTHSDRGSENSLSAGCSPAQPALWLT